MELVDIFRSEIVEFAREHPWLSIVAVMIFLYLIKEPVGKLIDTIDSGVGRVAETRTHLRTFRDEWSASANTKEEEVKQNYDHGVLTGASGSFVFLGIVGVLVLLNFALILRPLQDILARQQFQGVSLALIGAFAIAFAEFVAGAMFLNALGRSFLVPLRKRGDSPNRTYKVIAFAFLLTLSGIEAGLAVYRDYLRALDVESRAQQSIGSNVSAADTPPAAAAAPASLPAAPPAERRSVARTLQEANSALASTPAWVQAALGFLLPWIIMIAVWPVEFLLAVLPVLLRRLGGLVVWPFEALLFLLNVAVSSLGSVIKAVWDIVTMPVRVVHIGGASLLYRIFPTVFPSPGQ